MVDGVQPRRFPPLAAPRHARRVARDPRELINGRIVYQGMPGPVHGRAQLAVGGLVRGPYDRRPGGADRPGG